MDFVSIIAAGIAGAIGGGLGGAIATMFSNKNTRSTVVLVLAVAGGVIGQRFVKPYVEAYIGPSLRAGEFDRLYASQLAPEIKKIPALERIFRDDPAVEKRFKEKARAAYEAGGASGLSEAASGIGAEVLSGAMVRYLPRSRTQDLIQFAKVMSEVLGSLNAKDPEACILHQFGATYGKPLPTSRLNAAIGKEGQDKQLAVLNDLVLNATDTAPAFDKAKADAAITALAQRHAPLLTGSSAEVAGGKRLPKDVDEAKAACSFALALFKNLSTMDTPTAELILRAMFSAS